MIPTGGCHGPPAACLIRGDGTDTAGHYGSRSRTAVCTAKSLAFWGTMGRMGYLRHFIIVKLLDSKVANRSWGDNGFLSPSTALLEELTFSHLTNKFGSAMALAVSRRPLTAEARVRSRVGPCRICGGQSGTGTSLHNKLSRLRCVRSICYGALQ